MSKDQNPSDKACDAYFDNPYAATSGSYYSDRVTFYAGFAAGAASRDAEVARLKTVPMRYRRMAFNAQLQDEVARLEQENDQLRAQINMLREALEYCVTQVGELATVPGIASALATIPEQSLAAYRNKVIEECAEKCDAQSIEPECPERAKYCADAIRAMKEQP